MVMATAESFMRVAGIGYSARTKVDLQSHQKYHVREATVESLKSMAKNVWDRVISAIRVAITWFFDLLDKIVDGEHDDRVLLESIKDKAKSWTNSSDKNLSVDFKIKRPMKLFLEPKIGLSKSGAFESNIATMKRLSQYASNWLSVSKPDAAWFKNKATKKPESMSELAEVYESDVVDGSVFFVGSAAAPKSTASTRNRIDHVKSFRVTRESREDRDAESTIGMTVGSLNLYLVYDAMKHYLDARDDLISQVKSRLGSAESEIKQLRAENLPSRVDDMDAKQAEQFEHLNRLLFFVRSPAVQYMTAATMAFHLAVRDISHAVKMVPVRNS
jgi:hypothetical protein